MPSTQQDHQQEEFNEPNLSSNKKLWLGVLIGFLLIGIFFFGFNLAVKENSDKNNQETQIKVQLPEKPTTTEQLNKKVEIEEEKNIDIDDKTADWKIYKNEKYGLEMKYPNNFKINSITSDESVLTNNKNGVNWNRVELKDANDSMDPLMRIEINMGDSGYGPFFPNKEFQINEDQEGNLIIEKIDAIFMEDDNITEYKTQFLTNLFKSKNNNSYWMFFVAKEGAEEYYYQLFNQILSTIKFINYYE